MSRYTVAEVCAGGGGQALGLQRAGFRHVVLLESDRAACVTLRSNRPSWNVAEGDVTCAATWDPARYRGVDLLAGGVPCQPYTVAGRQRGAADERDLLGWVTGDLCRVVIPRALLVENVPGLGQSRFAGYRQELLAGLAGQGYAADWRVLKSCDFGVPQLRPRFVLVAMRPADFRYFSWPAGRPGKVLTVGEALQDMMGAGGWRGAAAWARQASRAAPTIVGGSSRHGGPDLGPTRAKAAWRELGVDARGIADAPPPASAADDHLPMLTKPHGGAPAVIFE